MDCLKAPSIFVSQTVETTHKPTGNAK